ncbi:MAG: sugar phosphate nucleotidyltransferase [Desulfovibrio sp.]
MRTKDISITLEATVKDALRKLNQTSDKLVVVTDRGGAFCGVISDGDIRRHILAGGGLKESIAGVYNPKPVTLALDGLSRETAGRLMREHRLEAIPILDGNRLAGYLTWEDVLPACSESQPVCPVHRALDCPVVIMAGGKGTRMAPFTHIFPKPLIPVGDKVIMEWIVDTFRAFGVDTFVLVINYLAPLIESYFGTIERNYAVDFIREKKFLGTAGSLRQLLDSHYDDFIISNCDVIVRTRYDEAMDFHRKNKSMLTIISAIQNIKIPYGVMKFGQHGHVSEIVEKPEYSFIINTGLYIINREALSYIPSDTFYDMPTLIQALIDDGKQVFTFPVNEGDYLDFGQWNEYRKALESFDKKWSS